MANVSEIDILKAIDQALSSLEDEHARDRVRSWAWKKFSSNPLPTADKDMTPSRITRKPRKPKKRAPGGKSKPNVKTKPSLTMVKDLNFKPKGKKSLEDFAEIKKPRSFYEKCAVSAYYLKYELALSAITESHVYTCFKYMKWRGPTNLSNTLALTASHYGWLDTSNLQDIKVTPMGENLVEHDLPEKKGPKKS